MRFYDGMPPSIFANVSFMRKNGCTVIKRNYQCRFGEIDIIAEKGEYIIFTEVKTRREGGMVSPAESLKGIMELQALLIELSDKAAENIEN